MTESICNTTNTTKYTDTGDYAKNTLIIQNHLITNLIDEYNGQVLIILIFALYFYQCTKIHYYSQNQKKAIEFQILFIIWTLTKILQLSYGWIGIQVDQSNHWQQIIKDSQTNGNEDKKLIKQNYCDPQLFYLMEECQKCYVRFEVNGLIFSINYVVNIIVVQMITFFWQWQISPLMFLGLKNNVLMNQFVPRDVKIFYAIFVLMDLLLLGNYILMWVLIYYNSISDNSIPSMLMIVQIIATVLTLSYFLYNFYVKKSNGERFDLYQKLAVVFIGLFLLFRVVLSILYYFNPEIVYDKVKFQKTTLAQIFLYISSLLMIISNILDFQQRIYLIEIF